MSEPEPSPYFGDMVTVARFDKPVEANLLKGMLEAAGIPATVADANLMQAHSLASAFTVVWYIFSGHAQSKHIASSHGSKYVKRPLLPMWLGAILGIWALGNLGSILQ